MLFNGNQIKEQFLTNINSIKEGDFYNYEELINLNNKLMETNWFKFIFFSSKFNTTKNSNIINLFVTLLPNKKNFIETIIGYSNNFGPYIKTIWNKPWINIDGKSLKTRFNFYKKEKKIHLIYKIPFLIDPIGQYLLFQNQLNYINNVDKIKILSSMTIAYYKYLSENWNQYFNFKWNLNFLKKEDWEIFNNYIYPKITIHYENKNLDSIFLNKDNYFFEFSFSNKFFGSSSNFVIFESKNLYNLLYYKNHSIIIRGNLGCIKSNNLYFIPVNLRFFAGGDQNIRGYKYRSISTYGNGSSKLITLSLEYQYRIFDKLWSVFFIDLGDATNKIKDINPKIGIGTGIRWKSPIGILKLDFAIPFTYKNCKNLKFYFRLGKNL